MSCEQCLHGCPNCRPPKEECPVCQGWGRIFYLIDPETDEQYECSKEEYDKAVDEYRYWEPCEYCDGEGFL